MRKKERKKEIIAEMLCPNKIIEKTKTPKNSFLEKISKTDKFLTTQYFNMI